MAWKKLPIALFGIPWTAHTLFFTFQWMEHAPSVDIAFLLFMIPFFVVGFGMLLSPCWAHCNARHSAYLITDRRAIVFTRVWPGDITVRSFEPKCLTDLRRTQHADGSGDLVFTQDSQRDSDGDRRSTAVGFLATRDVKAAEELVRALTQRSAG